MEKWTEDAILSLPKENRQFDRKGSALLDFTMRGANQDDTCRLLAKQLSAFANSGGGAIIIGVNDDGEVDNGGVPRIIKGRSTAKDWLETTIPTLTDNTIVGFSVTQIERSGSDSKIAPEKLLIVVDVPDSEQAPHQSTRDHLYYVRLSGTSVPAEHWMLEDIRNRSRHPQVKVIGLSIEVRNVVEQRGIQEHSFDLDLRLRLQNSGRVVAKNLCLTVSPNLGPPRAPGPDRRDANSIFRTSASPEVILAELLYPIYPGLEILVDWSCSFRGCPFRSGIAGSSRWGRPDIQGAFEDSGLDWAVFADNAPPTMGSFPWKESRLESALNAACRGLRR